MEFTDNIQFWAYCSSQGVCLRSIHAHQIFVKFWWWLTLLSAYVCLFAQPFSGLASEHLIRLTYMHWSASECYTCKAGSHFLVQVAECYQVSWVWVTRRELFKVGLYRCCTFFWDFIFTPARIWNHNVIAVRRLSKAILLRCVDNQNKAKAITVALFISDKSAKNVLIHTARCYVELSA